jgi:hypothetical protein
MGWFHINNNKARPPRPDRQSLFVVNYQDGSRAFLRVPPEITQFGASPPVMRAAEERQSRGELPPGKIERLVRVL